MMHNDVIPVIFYFDNNYVMPAAVTFFSIMENASKNYNYKFHVLHSDITEANQKLLEETLKDFKNVSLDFMSLGNKFDDLWDSLPAKGHYTKETFYKMLVASNFPQYDKVITTDVDVVFLGDIAPSYFVFDENSKEYLAGIKPVGKILWYYDTAYKKWSKEEVDKMKFCGGYLLINTKQIRQDNLEQKFIEFFKNNLFRLSQAEQDILNMVCYPNIKYLPLNNLVCSYFYDYYQQEEDFINDAVYSESELKNSMNHPIQLHYATSTKPWKNPDCTKSEEWFKVLAKTPFLPIYLKTLANNLANKKTDIEN